MNTLRIFTSRALPVLVLLILSVCSEPEVPKPEITSLDPVEGAVGTSVRIIGKNLSGVKTLVFGATTSYIASKSDTEIITVVPPALLPGNFIVTVTSDAGQSNEISFEVTASEPEISSVLPDRGSVGMDVTISGKHFTGATSVNFGAKAVTSFTSNSDLEIKLKVPEGIDPGAVDLTVITPGGTSPAETFTIVGKPTIPSFAPVSGPVGRVISIAGTHFEDVSKVLFGTVEAVYQVKNTSLIETTVPLSAVSGKIKVVTTGGEAVSETDFLVKDAPIISAFNPTTGITGTAVTIIGQGFDAGQASVKFGSGNATELTVVSATQITAKVPATATTGKITVETIAGASLSADNFTVIGAPTISAFTPTSGQTGAEVTITGTTFINITAVRFNATNVSAANYTVVSPTQVKATVPSGATTGKLSIVTPAGTANSSVDFTVLLPPVITSFAPGNGAAGSSVVITGAGFTGTTSVKFNGVEVGASNFTVNSTTQITANVPGAATSGKISISNAQGTAVSANNFYITPFISTVNPVSALPGATITLTGTNMENATVRFNSTLVSAATNTATSITVAVPSGLSGAVNITIVNLGGTSNSKSFTITSTVVVDEIIATQNITDQLLLFKGTNLQGATKVMFGSAEASVFTNTSKVVTTKIPTSLSAGSYTVTVVTSNGTSNGKIFEVLNSQNPNTGQVSMVNGASVVNLPPGYVPPVSNQWYNTFNPDEKFLISESDNSVQFSNALGPVADGTITFDKPNNYVEINLAGIRYVGVWTPRSTQPDGFGGTRCFAHMTLISAESGKQLELAVEYFDDCP